MIKKLNLKLDGKLPVTREELFELIASWGKNNSEKSYVLKRKECYPLENLDVSKIEDLSDIFCYSFYDGDLSKWDVSNVKYMQNMFERSYFNNDSLNSWNISKVRNIEFMFYKSKFNGDISNWNVSNIINMRSAFDNCPFDRDISKWKFNPNIYCYEIFCDNKYFINKYNNGFKISTKSNDFLKWFEENRNKIASLNISKEEISNIDDYLETFNLEKEINRSK